MNRAAAPADLVLQKVDVATVDERLPVDVLGEDADDWIFLLGHNLLAVVAFTDAGRGRGQFQEAVGARADPGGRGRFREPVFKNWHVFALDALKKLSVITRQAAGALGQPSRVYGTERHFRGAAGWEVIAQAPAERVHHVFLRVAVSREVEPLAAAHFLRA